ncbi:MAG: sensor histidine kinase, partial [Solirubrobacteraceae bacterium]
EQDLSERAEAANTAKSVFLATMSHELRTPLTAIIGYEELLATGITGSVTDPQREQLARIKRSATHLLRLIDEVLNLARLEGKREAIQRTPVRVAELTDWAVTLIAPLAAAKGLQFFVQRPDPPLTLSTDALKARQILVNLLGNAVKFTDHGEVALTVRVGENMMSFEVRDTGVGIRQEDLERVFDRFWQVEQTAARRAEGSGLGLTLSRDLARLLGGDITVESEWRRGSTFTLHLPLGAAGSEERVTGSG